jgi:hypothetical protein
MVGKLYYPLQQKNPLYLFYVIFDCFYVWTDNLSLP